MGYADRTTVAVEDTRNEIERTLTKYGASAFGFMANETSTMIMCKVKTRAIRLMLPKFKSVKMNPNQLAREERRRWRALLLVIKAKLEAIQSGIATFEDEFLPYTVMADGKTVGEWAKPQLDRLIAGDAALMLGAGHANG